MKDLSSIAKNVIILCLLAGVIVLGFLFYRESERRADAESAIHYTPQGKPDLNLKPEAKFKDPVTGENHVVMDAEKNKLINATADAIVNKGLKPTVDSIAKQSNIKAKQVEGTTVISSSSMGTDLKAIKKENDSLKRMTVYYKDKYLELAYRPASPTDTTDLGSFDYKYSADLTINQFWKRNFFLGARHSYLDIFSNDPRTTINGVKRLTIEHAEPSFGLRVQALTTYNFRTQLLSPGAGLRFDIGAFSARGALFYNSMDNRFSPTLEGAYTIFSVK